ncbi:HNH endonuclease [Variovorax boronicumulans]|uniref:HNH endonuclease n=1 Tax=Variovorax boronicumulans TaxID=436515 RepID=UPI00132F6C78
MRQRAKRKAWRESNPDRAKGLVARWRANNPERVAALHREWKKANPTRNRIYRQNRRKLERQAGGKISNGIAEKLFKLQRGCCACCSLPLGRNYHLDHVVPLALGGEHADSNLQLLRQRCNNQKKAKHPVDFMRERGFLL